MYINKKEHLENNSGTVLITLLVFMLVGIIVTTGAITVSLITVQGTSKLSFGEEALRTAESGAENAILRILRDPSYSGETLTIDNGTATINVSGTNTVTIVSEGNVENFIRKVEVVGTLSNNQFNLTSWTQVN